MRRGRVVVPVGERSAFVGFRFPPEVITVAVRWYLRYGLSYRDVEELLAERGVEVDHVTVYRWVQRFAPLLADAARPCRHAPGDRWFVDESYLKVAGRWRYLYRAVDQFGQVIDVLLSEHRDTAAARRFFTRALQHGSAPAEVTTDRAPVYLKVLDELVPAARHVTEQYANNPIECDHGRLKARLQPMRGLKRLRCAAVIAAGHAFVQNLLRGSYELGLDVRPQLRLATAFTQLAQALSSRAALAHTRPNPTTQRRHTNSFGSGSDDAFLLRLQPSGARIDASLLGGSAIDHANDVAVTAGGSINVGGSAQTPPWVFQDGRARTSRLRGTVAAPTTPLAAAAVTVADPGGTVTTPNGSTTYAGSDDALLLRIVG